MGATQREAVPMRCRLQMIPARPDRAPWLQVFAAWFALLALALVVACGGGGESSSGDEETPDILVSFPSPSGDVTPRPRKTPIPSESPSPTPLKVCAPNPDPAQPSVLQVEDPKPEQQVKVPFHVRGWGANIGFQNQGVAVAIVNAKQETVQVLDLPPQPRTFRIAPPGLEITEFTRPFGADIVISGLNEATPFCLWIYQQTDEQGSPKGVVQIPVVVAP